MTRSTPPNYIPQNTFKQALVRMLERSTLTSGVLAIILVLTAGICTVMQIPVPDYIQNSLYAVIVAFFSVKAQEAGARHANEARQGMTQCPTK